MAEARHPGTGGGGGGGADVKGGTETAIASGTTRAVTFSTAFSATPAVVLSVNGQTTNIKEETLAVSSVSTTGFTIYHSSKSLATIDVDWIATDAGDP